MPKEGYESITFTAGELVEIRELVRLINEKDGSDISPRQMLKRAYRSLQRQEFPESVAKS